MRHELEVLEHEVDHVHARAHLTCHECVFRFARNGFANAASRRTPERFCRISHPVCSLVYFISFQSSFAMIE